MSLLEKIFGIGSSPLLDASFRDVGQMLDQSGRMFDVALAGLLGNTDIRQDLEEMDDVVDRGERDVRRRVAAHVAVDPSRNPIATLVLATMVQDAERLGDYARGLAEIIPLAKGPRSGQFSDRLQVLAARLRPLFEETKRVLLEDDPDGARRLMAECRELKKSFIELTADVADSDLGADMAVVYASAARMMRRIGAHISNLASSVCQPYQDIRHDDEDT